MGYRRAGGIVVLWDVISLSDGGVMPCKRHSSLPVDYVNACS